MPPLPHPPPVLAHASLMPARLDADLQLMGASHLICGGTNARLAMNAGSQRAEIGLGG